MYQLNFQKTLNSNFADKRAWKKVDIVDFKRSEPKWYTEIHVDINRSLFQFADLLRVKGITAKQAQAIFERYFIDVYVNQPANRRDNYYEGITDVFEFIFFANVDLTVISKHLTDIITIEDKFETYDGDISKFFKCSYQKVVSIGINVMERLWKESGFKLEYFITMGKEVAQLIAKNDPELGKFVGIVSMKQQEISFMKYTISCCLHLCLTPEIGFLISNAYLTSDRSEQIFIIENIISLGSRQLLAGLPPLEIVANPQYQVMPGKIDINEKSDDMAYMVLQESVPMVYRLDAASAGEFLTEVRVKYNKIEAEKTTTIAVGTGTAVLAAVGIIGGILGAILK